MARLRLRTDVRHGVALIGADPFIRRLLAVQVLAVLSVGGTGALLVVLAREQLGLDEADFAAARGRRPHPGR